MAFAVNILALIIVLGLCWAAMLWLSGRFHGHGGATTVEIDGLGDFTMPPTPATEEPCDSCEGVGALTDRGKLAPCPQCYGTGIPR